jgi:DNA-3-methyladenine glycosylase II
VTQPRKKSEDLKQAMRHLRKVDPVMRRVIDHVGPCTLKCERDRFWMLVRSILSQQISTAAARTVRDRVVALVESSSGSKRVTPTSLLTLTADELRTAGVSRRKAEYMLDLAGKVDDGEVRLSTMGRLPNEGVIESLIQVRNAMLNLYEMDQPASHDDFRGIAEPWRPYATIGSWYCWRSLESDIPAE